MQYISTNFAYGNGPYLRCIDLSLAINKEFKKRNIPEMRILVPLVYGDKQKKIILENFGNEIKENPNSIFLDENYGKLLKKLFFKGKSYKKNLEFLIKNQPKIEERIINHLSSNFKAENLEGKRTEIKYSEIDLEVSHNPRVSTHFTKSFYTTIAFFSEILQRSIYERSLNLDKRLLDEATKIAIKIELDKTIHFMPEPFTFSYEPNRDNLKYIFTPPFIHIPKQDNRKIKKGMYVTITGIEGLDKLFRRINEFDMDLYASPLVDTSCIMEKNSYSSEILSNKSIKFQFARSGWSSVWGSHMTLTPLICPEYTESDDPEIYFNEKTLEKLGIATIFAPNSDPKKILKQAKSQIKNMKTLNKKIIDRYGTLDGINYTAKIITEYLMGEDISKYPRTPVL